MPSIEILVEKPGSLKWLMDKHFPFAIRVSTPPLSHREPSIWQSYFESIGGALVHLGNPLCDSKGYQGAFYAYELLVQEDDTTRLRFKPEYAGLIMQMLEGLIHSGGNKIIHFTSDWQFSDNKPETIKPMYYSDFVKFHDDYKIRFNSWIPIIADKCQSLEQLCDFKQISLLYEIRIFLCLSRLDTYIGI